MYEKQINIQQSSFMFFFSFEYEHTQYFKHNLISKQKDFSFFFTGNLNVI